MHVFLSPRPALTPWLDFIVLGFICLPTLQVFPCGAQASEGVPKRILLGGGMDWEEKGTTEDEMAGWHH